MMHTDSEDSAYLEPYVISDKVQLLSSAVGRILFLLPEAAFYLSAMKNSHHANWFGETSTTWKL